MPDSRPKPRIIQRSADGYFQAAGSSRTPPEEDPPTTRRNPDDRSKFSRRDRQDRPIDRERTVESTRERSSRRRPASPPSTRPAIRPQSPTDARRPTPKTDNFDDMLKALDDNLDPSPRSRPVAARRRPASPVARSPEANSLDFAGMSSSLDAMMDDSPRRTTPRSRRPTPTGTSPPSALDDRRERRRPTDSSRAARTMSDTSTDTTARRQRQGSGDPPRSLRSNTPSALTTSNDDLRSGRASPARRGRSNLSPRRTSTGRDREPTKLSPRRGSRGDRPTSHVEEDSVSERERLEQERLNRELAQKRAQKDLADRLEEQMVAEVRKQKTAQDRERRNSRSEGSNTEFSLLSRTPIDESMLVPDYLTALMTTLRNDKTMSPIPDDFQSPDAYAHWRKTMRHSLQEFLVKMIKYRFLVPPEPKKKEFVPVPIRFRVIQAQGLMSKEGRSRSTYCNIEYGDLSNIKHAKEREVFRTETIENSLDPRWNQNMKMETKSLTDSILLQVWDRGKDQFLGQAIIPMSELISNTARSGAYEKWIPLQPKDNKGKDKYVGGRIQIGATLLEEKQEFQATLASMEVDNRSLFDLLLRACIVLDLFTPREGRYEVLSPEAVTMLKSWALTWNISPAYQVISYLKILFEKYTEDAISISDVLKAFHFLSTTVKTKRSFSSVELGSALELLENMKTFCADRVVKYKELFPKNQPRGALESTILMLRMIHKFPGWREKHPELQESPRDELRIMMTESCIVRFQRFKELSTPLDEGNVESVVDGINKLADLVNEEIDLDVQELDIVRLTAENQLKYFVLTLEDSGDVLESDDAVQTAPHQIFELYKTVRQMSERYTASVSDLSKDRIEMWFAPFMYKWLHQLSLKTTGWVSAAVKADNFEPKGFSEDDEIPLHSSSITDVFSAIYSELEFITELKWSDPVQNAQFFQGFAKYCDAIAIAEKKTSTGVTMVAFTEKLMGARASEPKDIEQESCAKLRNVSFAMTKLREMYRMMNVTAITRTVRNHRKSMAVLKKSPVNATASNDKVHGAFKIHASYAENIKPLNKNGTTNAYVVVRVPEGTVVPPEEKLTSKSPVGSGGMGELGQRPAPAPVVLTGNASRAIGESLNPTWDETFQVILPPVQRLDVAIFNSNLLTADEVAGTAIIDLSVGSRLRRKLVDHQTHDIYVELEPQGRVLLRLTMEGEDEDVDYWFRRTNEHLIRTRDSFLRSLTAKITPYITSVLIKSLKEQEAAPLPSKGFFSSLTSAVEYSDKTAAGHSISEPVVESDGVVALAPVIDYLEKNLQTLCSQLPLAMAHEVIQHIWTVVLTSSTNSLVPPLFGQIALKHLNIRQASMASTCVSLLRDFFHGDGGEYGLELSTLDSALYMDLQELIKLYHEPILKLKREYELSLLGGKHKEHILRLVRLVSDKNSEDAKWVDAQLVKRRDRR